MFRIYGTTGAYSDSSEWTVGITRHQEVALKLVEKYNQWCKDNNVYDNGKLNYKIKYDMKCPFDPSFQVDYTGTEYHWEEIRDLDEEEITCQE